MSDLLGFAHSPRVARVLLVSLLMSCVAPLAGCIVPVELTPQRTVANSRPSIITSEVDPPQGQNVVHALSDLFSFSVVADDADIDDPLNARLFRTAADGKSRVALYDILLSPSDAGDPQRRSGTFIARPYCQTLKLNGSEYVSIRVSDSVFPNQDDQTPGLFDDVYWVLQCQ